MTVDPTQFNLTMSSIATPDSKQSAAYIATYALFQIFGSSPKEDKVFLRLPPAWRELWTELLEARKGSLDAKDRAAVKEIRSLVRKRQDQELEDGVILQGAFKGRGTNRALGETGDDANQDLTKQIQGSPEYYQKIWQDKAASPRFQNMLVCGPERLSSLVSKKYSNLECSCQCGSFESRSSRLWTASKWSLYAAKQGGKFHQIRKVSQPY
jgi:hypothetical protein